MEKFCTEMAASIVNQTSEVLAHTKDGLSA